MNRRALALAGSVAALLGGGPARAQVNAEALRSALRDHPTFASIDASLVGRAGNTRNSAFSGALFAGVTSDPHVAFAKASADYGQAAGKTTVARWVMHARYNYWMTSRVAMEVLGQAQHDRFRRLLVRDLYGSGLRWMIVEQEDLELIAGTTYLVEHEALNAIETSPGSSSVVHRSSSYFAINAHVNTLVDASTVTYMQPRFDHPSDYHVLHESFVTVALSTLLAVKISATFWYDSDPPLSVGPFDLEVKNSLQLRFY